MEVIVVDDGSSDATAQRAEALGARVLRHPCRMGYGRSLKDGIASARHDVVIIMDGDGSYPVERIPDLLREMERGFDVVVGARSGAVYRGSFLKIFARLCFRWLAEFVAGRRIPDINSGLRAFRRRDIVPLFPHLCEGFSFTTTHTLIAILTCQLVAYVPISYAERRGSSKVRIVHDSLQTLQYLVEVISVFNPLKAFLLLVFGLLGIAVVALVAGWYVSSPLLILSSFLSLLFAVLVFSLGLLAHLLRMRRPAVARLLPGRRGREWEGGQGKEGETVSHGRTYVV